MRLKHLQTAVLGLLLGLALVLAPAAAGRAVAGELLCSTYPVYLFTRALVQGRDHFNVRLLIDPGLGCPHDYHPTPADLERLSRAQVLAINGLGLETFLPQALRVAKADLKIIDASGGRAAWTDGAPPVVDLDRARIAASDEGPGHGHSGPNPHIFAAPGSAAVMVRNLAEGLARSDPAGADAYRANAAALAGELEALAAAFRLTGQQFGRPRVLVGHSIFDYLARDMELEIMAAIEEADGADPSAARLRELTGLARREKVRAVLIDPQGNVKLARTLGTEAKIPVAVIDPAASGPADAPLDYFQKVMGANLEVLAKLFSGAAAEGK